MKLRSQAISLSRRLSYRAGFTAILPTRFLVATARNLGIPLMTRDSRILDYAKAGHVRAARC